MFRTTTIVAPARPPRLFAFLLPLAAVLLCSQALCAATWYVKPSTEVPVRSGQGTEFKILAVVPDGMALELLEEADPWARVKTPGGTEGWLLKRYLSSEPTPAHIAAALQTDKARLTEENSEISGKFNELSRAHAESVAQLEACRAERDEARNNYDTLRQDTADVISTKKNLTDMAAELLEARGQLTAAEKKYNSLKQKTSLMWFLAGALVLLCGWFLGSISARSRKRKTTLY